jgi:hypothetical protein
MENLKYSYDKTPDSLTLPLYTLENHLETFSKNPNYHMLWISWNSEKEEYIKRLSTISHKFNSYSLHDESHSRIILNRIEALLGVDRILLLSPTDTWLLLQCAYTHDIGMCIYCR